MKRHYNYESLIGQKLASVTTTIGTDGLWAGMEAILDREMPQQPERKRKLRPWWFSANALLVASLLTAGAYVWKRQNAEKASLPIKQVMEKDATAAVAVLKNQVAAQPISESNVINPEMLASKKLLASTNKATEKNELPNAFSNTTKKRGLIQNTIASAAHDRRGIASELNNAVVKKEGSSDDRLLAEAAPIKINAWNVSAPMLKLFPSVSIIQSSKPKRIASVGKGISVGIELNHQIAIGNQRNSSVNMSGKTSRWQDYIPSVYAQYHFSKKLYAQAEWSPVAAQYTPTLTLYHSVDESNPEVKDERFIKLNKLFYTNIPVSLHYHTPLKGITIGAGIQYSSLRKVILQDQEYAYLVGSGQQDINEKKNEIVAKDPGGAQKTGSGNAVNDVAGTFKKSDWRLLGDVGYGYKALQGGLRFTGGLFPYVSSNFTGLRIKDRAETMQVYLRYNLFDGRKK